jgi:multidrug efflux system outer membrane protein
MARDAKYLKHGLTLALVFTLNAATSRADVLRLADVEQQALRAHPQLAAQDAKIRRARAQEELARSARRPNLVARGDGSVAPGGQIIQVNDITDTPYLVSGSRGFGDPGAFNPQLRYSAGLGASANLWDFGRTSLQIEAAQAQVSAENAAVEQVKLSIVLDVRRAYASWLEAAEAARIANEQLERLQGWATKIDQLIAEGARPSSDGALARYEAQRGQLAALRATSARSLALSALESVVQSDLPDDATADASLLEVSDGDSGARGARPDSELPATKLLERQRRAAAIGARALDRTHAPVLAGAAEVGIRGQASELFPVYRVSLGLTVPLWDGGEQAARAAMAHADADELSARLSEAKRAESEQLKLSHLQIDQSEQELKLALQVQTSAQTLLEQAVERYQLGGGGIEPVLDAQHTLADAELEVLQARLTRLNASLKLRPAPSGS